jgi:hypothetical protein
VGAEVTYLKGTAPPNEGNRHGKKIITQQLKNKVESGKS